MILILIWNHVEGDFTQHRPYQSASAVRFFYQEALY